MLALDDWENTLLKMKEIIKNEDNDKILSFLEQGAKFRKDL